VSALAITTRGLGKQYRIGGAGQSYITLREAIASTAKGIVRRGSREPVSAFWALRDLDLDLTEGEVLGVIGRNGAGKSTLLKLLSRITEPSAGVARVRGRVGALLEVGTGFHPELTGRENIYLNGAILGMSRRDITTRFDEIVDFAEVERFLDTPLKRYSSGMQLRLAFAVAAHLEPDVVIVDEVLAVGDTAFREKCMGKMSELRGDARTVLFVSHDLGSVTRLCSRVVWLERGTMREDGPAGEIVERYIRETLQGGQAADLSAVGELGQVTVRAVGLLDAHGEPLDSPRRDQTFMARIVLSSRVPSAPVGVSFQIEGSDGVRVLDDSTTDRDETRDLIRGPGEWEAVARFPPLLKPGDYSLCIWLGTQYEEFVVHQHVLGFRVRPSPTDDHESLIRLRAVRPEVEWQVQRLGDLDPGHPTAG
jgi:ABC-type polysaccharide/polyol phosphate transport system ATPase subunit